MGSGYDKAELNRGTRAGLLNPLYGGAKGPAVHMYQCEAWNMILIENRVNGVPPGVEGRDWFRCMKCEKLQRDLDAGLAKKL